jgi:muramoyltetrapeptide carboxypeptidase
MIKPPKLNPGDTVGVISPAGPVAQSDLAAGLHFIESQGFQIRLGRHVYDRREYLAGSDADRLWDLEDMFRNSEVKAIFCSRGGYGSMRLLGSIDYGLIQETPKILVGYSDITALLAAVVKQSGLITFHGPMVKELSNLTEKRWRNLIQMISSEKPIRFAPMEGYPISGGKASGRMMGGNLSLLCGLMGTPFMPDLTGSILFVEDRGEALYRLDRMFMQLTLAGCLKGIKGLIVGHFEGCGSVAAIEEMISGYFKPLNIPIAAGFPLGHGSGNCTLPIGSLVELDTDIMNLSLLEPTVV